MSCSGLHCAGCGGGAGVPAAALLALEGGAWVAAHIIEVAAVSAACAALALAAVAALMRRQERREAAYAAARGIRSRADVMLPAPPPQVSRAAAPAIENHVHYHLHVAGESAARTGSAAIPRPVRKEIVP